MAVILSKIARYRIVCTMLLLLIGGAAVAIVGENTARHAIEGTKRANARGTLFRIAFVLRDYHRTNGRMPSLKEQTAVSAYKHGWRSTVAKLVEPRITYLYDINDPWDSPRNLRSADEVRAWFQTPEYLREGSVSTQVLALDCEGSAWRTETPDIPNRIPFLVFVEDSDTLIMEPRDLSLGELYSIVQKTENSVIPPYAAFMDGSVTALRSSDTLFDVCR